MKGVGKDAPTVVNDNGGAQSHIPYRFDLFPAHATAEVAAVFAEGATKYARNNWKLIPENEHLNHVLTHIFAYMEGDRQDNHLAHAACRMLMALEMKDDSYDYNEYEPLREKQSRTGSAARSRSAKSKTARRKNS